MSTPTLPPLQPIYVLRGHAAAIHALRFSPGNHRLLTADADGWVISWSLASKRPEAVWRAHTASILGIAWWGPDAVLTHGRDSKLVAWRLGPADEAVLPKRLPLDHADPTEAGKAEGEEARRPAVLREMTVNTLNFCAFACTPFNPSARSDLPSRQDVSKMDPSGTLSTLPPLLLAVPHTLASEAVDIHVLPLDVRIAIIPTPKLASPATGLIMALAFASPNVLFTGYEGGQVLAYARPSATDAATWPCVYRARPHAQPVLSLAAFPSRDAMLSTAADAVVAKHQLSPATVGDADEEVQREAEMQPEETAARVVKTGHSGQQGARVRGDGKVCAAAGWDRRARVYAGTSLREVAVLKWHKEGCYAVDFAGVLSSESSRPGEGAPKIENGLTGEERQVLASRETIGKPKVEVETEPVEAEVEGNVIRSEPTKAARRREEKAWSTHWLAVGSKDGKVSLWDVF